MTRLLDDLMTPEAIADPHASYHRLRTHDPVHWNERWGGWILTGYDEVVEVLRDTERFSADRMAYLETEITAQERCTYRPIFDVLSHWMVFIDPPDHTRLRRLLNTRFTPRSVEQYRPRVRSIVNRLLKELEPKGGFEVVHDFAYLVPLTVILELLGAPALDRDLIKHWSEQLGAFFFLRADEPKRREIACEGATSLVEYLKPLIAERRESPALDLISALVACEESGEMTEQEVIATCVLLVFGGHETTMNLIANGTLALAQHPDQWRRLAKEPALVESAVEEILRYDGTVKATVRWARHDADIGSKHIQAGQKVLCVLSAANRDPAKFADPDTFDVTRHPNPHVAFGQGIHICLGAPLARLEAQEAIAGLTRTLPVPTIDTSALVYHPTVVSRALRELPITFAPTA